VELCCFADWQSASFGESKRIINAARAEYHSALPGFAARCYHGAGIELRPRRHLG